LKFGDLPCTPPCPKDEHVVAPESSARLHLDDTTSVGFTLTSKVQASGWQNGDVAYAQSNSVDH
jgi:hypothetical protein